MRAKPIRLQSPSWPAPQSITWPPAKINILLHDLDLDLRKDPALCRQLFDALALTLGDYKPSIAFLRTIPRPANRLAELNKLLPALEKSYQGLLDLSFMARQDVKNARVNAKADAGQPIVPADVAQSRRTEQTIDCATTDLIELTIACKQAIQNLSKERRGRKSSPMPVLVERLAQLFAHFDQGDHDEDGHRRDARIAFIIHALAFSGIPGKDIPTRKRLASILSIR